MATPAPAECPTTIACDTPNDCNSDTAMCAAPLGVYGLVLVLVLLVLLVLFVVLLVLSVFISMSVLLVLLSILLVFISMSALLLLLLPLRCCAAPPPPPPPPTVTRGRVVNPNGGRSKAMTRTWVWVPNVVCNAAAKSCIMKRLEVGVGGGVYVWVGVCMYVCMYVCMCMCGCVCVYVYVWVYVESRTPTHHLPIEHTAIETM